MRLSTDLIARKAMIEKAGFATVSESGQILIVDASPQIRRILRVVLIAEGYEVWDARTGEEALSLLRSKRFDLILLDVALPNMSGIEVCREIRTALDIVIIVLTAENSERGRIGAFDAGADDCLTIPFDTPEVLARIRAHLRRQRAAAGLDADFVSFNDLVVDFGERTVTRQEKKMHLPPKEYHLLRYLVRHHHTSLSNRTLLQAVWGPDYGEETTLLQAAIAQLRRKIEADPSQPRYIVTIPWFGYRFEGPINKD